MMKWIVGISAIVAFIAIVVGIVALLGEPGFALIALGAIFWLVAPALGESIIDWYEERVWQRKHPWPSPPPNLTERDLDLMRKHTHNE